ncbi:hypothetical protein TNIN_199141 [Trichonephila inaurata madagascariensis]|uniref:Uncharacterized protein n=1 Tax=Trichonephila inaurata madagascariensis TaxID=2747483 RepID=A0A8X6XQI9_9ARAC|nr:hypothetical protein TNIN_199141 [Trichonephila inaurata madagascariensis]
MRCFVPRYVPLIAKILRAPPFGENKKQISYPWRQKGGNTKIYSKEIIPREYGGDLNNYNEEDWLTKEVDKFYDRFLMLIKSCF